MYALVSSFTQAIIIHWAADISSKEQLWHSQFLSILKKNFISLIQLYKNQYCQIPESKSP